MELPEALRRLVPAGEFVLSDEGDGEPAFWLSDEPADPGLWPRLRAAHGEFGYWPLLLGADDDDGAPWATGEVFPDGKTTPADHDPTTLLREWWRLYAKEAPPFGDAWPAPARQADPDAAADSLAEELLAKNPAMRLGLVAAGSGAEALAASGWDGPANYTNDTGEIAAVVRDWERRYGVRVVALDGYATLYLSVSAPPADREQVGHLAAEHFAFCPDNIWQGAGTLATYAEQLAGATFWTFWWD